MFHKVLVLVCFMALVALAESEDQKWHFIRYQELLYGTTANLTCVDDQFTPWDTTNVDYNYMWILPNSKVLNATSVLGNKHYNILNNGSVLIIYSIDKPDFGIYYCLVQAQSDNIYAVVKLGININGPFFGNLWEIYSSNLKIGLISGFMVLIVMSMFCYNYDRFQATHDIILQKQIFRIPDENFKPKEMLYKNPAFDDEDLSKSQEDQNITNNIHASSEVNEAKTNL